MKRKKTVHIELDPEEVKKAVILLVGAKHPDLKEHLGKHESSLDFEGDVFVLMVDGAMDDGS